MRAQLEKAGFKDSTEAWPSDELLDVAIRAMIRHADDIEATQHAIFRACRNDAALLRQLILPWWRQCTAQLVHEARREIGRKERAGALETPQERRAGKVVSLIREREAQEAEWEHQEELARLARQKEENDRLLREQRDRWAATKASSFYVYDRPFWEVSTFRARQWQRHTAQGARFIDLVLSGVPEDDRPIGYYRRPEEINELWERSFADGA